MKEIKTELSTIKNKEKCEYYLLFLQSKPKTAARGVQKEKRENQNEFKSSGC